MIQNDSHFKSTKNNFIFHIILLIGMIHYALGCSYSIFEKLITFVFNQCISYFKYVQWTPMNNNIANSVSQYWHCSSLTYQFITWHAINPKLVKLIATSNFWWNIAKLFFSGQCSLSSVRLRRCFACLLKLSLWICSTKIFLRRCQLWWHWNKSGIFWFDDNYFYAF